MELLPFRPWQILAVGRRTLSSCPEWTGIIKGVGSEATNAERKWNENFGIALKAAPHLFRTSLALDVLISQELDQLWSSSSHFQQGKVRPAVV